jgi:hypothetical protein
LKQADLRDALFRDHDATIRAIIEDMNNIMRVVHMLTEAAKDLNQRLLKLEGGTDDIELEIVMKG